MAHPDFPIYEKMTFQIFAHQYRMHKLSIHLALSNVSKKYKAPKQNL